MHKIGGIMNTQEMAHAIIGKALKDYPIISSLETHEDAHQTIIRLDLGGFKGGKAITYSYSYNDKL